MAINTDHPGPGELPFDVHVRDAARGVQGAFDTIVETFYADIFKMIYYRTQSRPDAEDIAQEVFLSVFQNLSKLKSPERFRGWLFQIAVNKVKDYYRKKRWLKIFQKMPERVNPDAPESEQFQQPDAEKRLQEADFWNIFNRIVKTLSTMEKEVFMLKFLDHLSIREIAQALDRSESTVKTCLYRAIKKFQKEPALLRLFEEAWT
ncbi:MAG: sigma-70 family RNA polymerase sigma factor [Deltaproteobacteria bacterium]|nr:sigma-70 family RNA polymerase sigma factor [Deltaproteobacteria bacterium]MBW1956447.1 sigma-70 family RNA polymerase sigma factor [Deltaproteobacteria bacterium]MBW2042337.1 sigma-70 family RNA polymerase sigma factor [Deltaproteobacteria bacterium]MBW2133175.1 sigma-70 family RNA polymerase sigma factor [Deltaproteobacteria bacterium]